MVPRPRSRGRGVLSLLPLLVLPRTVLSRRRPPLPSPARPRTHGPFDADAVASFLRRRCGPPPRDDGDDDDPAWGGVAAWSYEGTLTDPSTGRIVAEVEGFELSRALPTVLRNAASGAGDDGGMLAGLSAGEALRRDPAPSWDAATTVLARRVFCYRRPRGSDGGGRTAISGEMSDLLTSIRLRPDGPLRRLSPAECVAAYDVAATYVSRDGGREMVVISERGGNGKGGMVRRLPQGEGGDEVEGIGGAVVLVGTAEGDGTDEEGKSFEFAIRARSRPPEARASGLAIIPPLKHPGSGDLTISPPRSRFLQIGRGDGVGSGGSGRGLDAVRETYRYSFEGDDAGENDARRARFLPQIKRAIGLRSPRDAPSHPACTVRCSRHGEAPPWYAPGRPCALELRGRRVAPSMVLAAGDPVGGGVASSDDGRHAPVASWVASHCDLWAGWPAAFAGREGISEDSSARRAVELFCDGPEPSLRDLALDDGLAAKRNRWMLGAGQIATKAVSQARRVSKSFVVTEVPRT